MAVLVNSGQEAKLEFHTVFPYRFPEHSLLGMIEKWHAKFLADLARRLTEKTPLSAA